MHKLFVCLVAALIAVNCTPAIEEPAELLQSGPDTPGFVRLSFNDDPSTTAAVVWRTQKKVDGAAVEYGASDAYGKSVKAESYQIDGFEGYYHKATMTGLQAGQTVHYRVGSKTGVSSDFVFQTAAGKDAADPIVFVIQGDSRAEAHGVGPAYAKLNGRLEKEAPNFILDSGDYTFSSFPDEWEDWQRDGEVINSAVPRLMTFGNHEMITKNYFELVSLPDENEEMWYSLDYGPIHIVCLYTGFGDLDTRTAAWLEKDLAASDAKWKVAFFHYPPYNAGHHHDDEVRMAVREQWVPLFEKYNVDVVASGHDHNYQNFGFLKGNQPHGDRELPLEGDGTAPLYVISGGAGAPTYGMTDSSEDMPLLLKSEKAENYMLATVKGNEMKLEVKRIDGTVIDTIVIKK